MSHNQDNTPHSKLAWSPLLLSLLLLTQCDIAAESNQYDFSLKNLTTSAQQIELGSSIQLSVTVANIGTKSTIPSVLYYYSSTNGVNYTLLNEKQPLEALLPNQSKSSSITIMPASPGNYSYGACIPVTPDEEDSNNNCLKGLTTDVVDGVSPDLVLENLVADPQQITVGSSITLSVDVANRGATAAGASSVQFQVSTDDGTTYANIEEAEAQDIATLEADQVRRTSINITPASAGTYYYGACVSEDANEQITTNNCEQGVQVVVTAVPRPDLALEDLAVSEQQITVGSPITISVNVANRGATAASASSVQFQVSTDDGTTYADEGTAQPIAALVVAGVQSASINITPAKTGTYYYGACVSEDADEKQTDNNCLKGVQVIQVIVTDVARPDLALEDLAVSEQQITVGSAITLSVNVANHGTAIARASSVQFQVSTDNVTFVNTGIAQYIAAFNTNLVIPSSITIIPASPGTYYYGACVSVDAEEQITVNNCQKSVVVVVEALPIPDLTLEDLVANPSQTTVNSAVTLSVNVANRGATAASASRVQFQVSTDTGTTYTNTGTAQPIAALGVAGVQSASINITPTSTGTYYYGACVSEDASERETDNNCLKGVQILVTDVAKPDLALDNLAVSEQRITVGSAVTILVDVANSGTANASASSVQFQVSTDTGTTYTDTGSAQDIAALDVAEVQSTSITITPVNTGTYYYGACVSVDANEQNTDNNCLKGVMVVVEALTIPDLALEDLVANPSQTTVGSTVTLSVNVANSGTANTSDSSVQFQVSTDGTTYTNTGSVQDINALVVAGEQSASINITPANTGTYYYGACVSEDANEQNTDNNCLKGVQVIVTAVARPDLALEDLVANPSQTTVNSTVRLSVNVANRGTANASTSRVQFQVSTDGTTYTNTGSAKAINALVVAGVQSASINITPANTGTYYYGACVSEDANEQNTDNNCLKGVQVIVTAVARPDLALEDLVANPSQTTVNSTVRLSVNVANRGTANASTSRVQFQVSTDGTTYTNTGSAKAINALVVAGVQSASITITPDSLGTYYYGACVSEDASEQNTDNNCLKGVQVIVTAVARPDLVLEYFAFLAGNKTASITIANRGTANASDISVKIQVSTDNVTFADIGAEKTISALDVNRENSFFLVTRLTGNYGTYYYRACISIDANEQNTDNNCSSNVIIIKERPPDLALENLAVSVQQIIVGSAVSISVNVANRGELTTIPRSLQFQVSTDGTTYTNTGLAQPIAALDASQVVSKFISITPDSPGTYYYGACVSVDTNEQNTDNNCLKGVQVVVTAVARPDLALEDLVANPSQITVGSAVRLSVNVANRGTANASTSRVQFQVSTDGTTYTNTGSAQPINALVVAGVQSASISITPASSGTYYYGACVSVDTNEQNTDNNCEQGVQVVVESLLMPDLVLDSLVATPQQITFGSAVRLSVDVINRGTATASASSLQFQVSTDAGTTYTNTGLAQDIAALNASHKASSSISITPASSGTYHYGACVSVANEKNTDNNCQQGIMVVVTAVPKPDLVLENLAVSEQQIIAGSTVTVSVDVANRSEVAASASSLQFKVSTDNTTFVDTGTAQPIAALNAEQVVSNFIIIPASPGTYYYGACVSEDANEQITDNNCSSSVRVIVIGISDLALENLAVSEQQITLGSAVRISVNVINSGTANASASRVQFQVSTDAGTTYTNTGSAKAINALVVDGEQSASINITPANTGTYYYGACVSEDADEQITDNNCQKGVQVVTITTRSDLVLKSFATSKQQVRIGSAITLSASVANSGNASANPSSVNFQVSTDNTNFANTGSAQDIAALALDEEQSVSIDISPAAPNTYYYRACVSEDTNEQNTANNCSSSITVIATNRAASDLVLASFVASKNTVLAGSSVVFSVTIANRGDRSTGQIIDSKLEISTDNITFRRSSGYRISLLLANAQSSFNSTVTYRNPGTYYYRYCISRDENENNTANNCSPIIRIDVIATPDLVPENLAVSETQIRVGEQVEVSVVVANRGTVVAQASSLQFKFSTNDRDFTDTGSVQTIAPLTVSGTQRASIIIRPDSPGTYHYRACVTYTNEQNTANNCKKSAPVEVLAMTRPDLVLENLTVSEQQIVAGSNVTFSVNVANRGEAAVGISSLQLQVSTNDGATYTNTGSAQAIIALNANQDLIRSITIMPSSGTYHYRACVSEDTSEQDITNNCSSSVRVVVLASIARPDLVLKSFTFAKQKTIVGESIEVSVGFANGGTAVASISSLQFQTSTDNITFSNIKSVTLVRNLPASGEFSFSNSITTSIRGTRYYRACVFVVPNELNTDNNCSSSVRIFTENLPDKVLKSLSVSKPQVTFITEVTISATIVNRGEADTRPSSLQFRFSKNGISYTNTGAAQDLATLSTNQMVTKYLTLVPPFTGLNYFGACVSEGEDSDLSNNCMGGLQVFVTSSPKSDLLLENIAVSSNRIKPGVSSVVSVDVANRGDIAAAASTLRFQVSTNNTDFNNTDSQKTIAALPIGQKQSAQITIMHAGAGDYYYRACVSKDINEENATNNCSSSIRITVLALPELVLTDFSTSATQIIAGSSLTVSAVIINSGEAKARGVYLRFYVSTDNVTFTNLGARKYISSFFVNELAYPSQTYKPPTAGDYYYRACILVHVQEQNPDNNCSSTIHVVVIPANSDFVAENFTVSETQITIGSSVRFSATVANRGNKAADASTLQIQVSTDDANFSDTGTAQPINALAVGQEQNTSIRITLTRLGTNYYRACVSEDTSEQNIANNCSSSIRIVVVAKKPDLVAENFTASPVNSIVNSDVILSVDVANRGEAAASASTLRFQVSTDNTNFANTGTAQVINALVVDGEQSASITIRHTSLGTYYYRACVSKDVKEQDTTNNCSSSIRVDIVVQSSDLVLENIAISPTQITIGASATLSVDVTNRGNIVADASKLQFQVSTDDRITYANTGTAQTIAALAAGSSQYASIQITPTRLGTSYYRACVSENVNGQDLTNNCSQGLSLAVIALTLADLTIERISISPSRIQLGNELNISFVSANLGETRTNSSPSLYSSLNRRLSEATDTRIPIYRDRYLSRNERSTTNVTYTPTEIGTYYYGVCVTGNTNESSTANNCSTVVKVVVTTNTSDLVFSGLTPSKNNVAKNERFIISGVLSNRGVVASSRSQGIKFRRSNNRTITNSDLDVATSFHAPIAAGGQTSLSVPVTGGSDYGRYYYGACIGNSNKCSDGVKVTVAVQNITGASFRNECSIEISSKVISATRLALARFSTPNHMSISPTRYLAAGGYRFLKLDVTNAGYFSIWSTGSSDIEAKFVKGDCSPENNHNYIGDLSSSNKNFLVSGNTEVGQYLIAVYGKNLASVSYKLHMTKIPSLNYTVDPLLSSQWHLDNNSPVNINIAEAWAITEGDPDVVAFVVDDGVAINHPDLVSNHYERYSYNYVTRGRDPDIPSSPTASAHGTAVAGIIIAEKDNGLGISGIAPNSRFAAANYTHTFLDSNRIDAAIRNKAIVAVSNNSWGLTAPGRFVDYSKAWKSAIEDGVENGYGGKGIFYVFAAGNDALVNSIKADNANYNGGNNFYAVHTACAVGDNGIRADYSEPGANLLVCGTSRGGTSGLTTTDLPGNRGYSTTDYTDNFGGTSAAAPVVSGVVALIRSANKELGWRDVKLILAATAQKIDAANAGWLTGYPSRGKRFYNGGTYNFNHEYGFGLVDAGAAVTMAQGWNNVPPLVISDKLTNTVNPETVYGDRLTPLSNTIDVSGFDEILDFIEYVQVNITLLSTSHGLLEAKLFDPNNNSSTLMEPHSCFNTSKEKIECVLTKKSIPFGSNRHNGTSPDGEWRITLGNKVIGEPGDFSIFSEWSIQFYGHKKP